MNILPKKCGEFKSKEYWNNFFNKLKNTDQENFQWYGNYNDFKQQLKKIFKHLMHKNTNANQQQQPPLNISHIGCGKSTFGEDILFDYPQFSIINSDYSEQVVKDMIKRSLMMKTMCRYEVCDMFEQLPEKYQGKFDVVLDKGTLDAILPQDLEYQVKKIKEVFFKNVQQSLNSNNLTSYIVISMLQPFVLRTLLQHFYLKPQYEIQIQQSHINDSKMQPFLVWIKRYPDSQEGVFKKISLKLLKGNKQLAFQSIPDVMSKIATIQETIASQQQVKNLSAFRHLTYNIANPQQPQKMRYTIQIIDNDESKLSQNTCAVFIVPQGKQNSYLFSNHKGLKRFVTQVGTSRLIVVKLLTGNTFKNIEQVKNEINPLIPNFIQKNTDPKNIPFMTDAEQLGSRKMIYQNEVLYVEQIAAGTEQAFRRVIFKNNLGLIQSKFRLVYENVEQNPHAKQTQKKTKILPAKKGKYVVIDKQYLSEGYCQQIVTGITKLSTISSKNENPKILMLGAGGYALSKFMYQNIIPRPHLVNVEIEKSLCSEELLEIFEVLHYTKTGDFQIINDDAYTFVVKQEQKHQYTSIIVDIAASEQQQVPPKQFLTLQFITRCHSMLDNKTGGILVFNVIRKGFIQNELHDLVKMKLFDLVFIAQQEDDDQQEEEKKTQDKQKEATEEDCMVVMMVKLPQEKRALFDNNAEKLTQYAEQLLMTKQPQNKKKAKLTTNSPTRFQLTHHTQWLTQSLSQLQLLHPTNKSPLHI